MYQDLGSSTSSGIKVSPDQLEHNAGQFATIGDEFEKQAGMVGVPSLPLGSSPPALWFVGRIADATGDHKGIGGHLATLAHKVWKIGGDERMNAQNYRRTDDDNATAFCRSESD